MRLQMLQAPSQNTDEGREPTKKKDETIKTIKKKNYKFISIVDLMMTKCVVTSTHTLTVSGQAVYDVSTQVPPMCGWWFPQATLCLWS